MNIHTLSIETHHPFSHIDRTLYTKRIQVIRQSIGIHGPKQLVSGRHDDACRRGIGVDGIDTRAGSGVRRILADEERVDTAAPQDLMEYETTQ